MRIRNLVLAAALAIVPAAAHAQVLTFEGLANAGFIGGYYNGGGGGNFGVTFSDNAQAFIQDEHGGTGNFDLLPSGVTGMVFLSGNAATIDVAGGFTTGFSFFYSAIGVPGVINVWSGLDETGVLLATLNLPTTPFAGDPACESDEPYCPFSAIGVAFAGTAMSVDFGGTENQIVFDDITIGSQTAGQGPGGAVPEPGTLSLMATGLVGMVGAGFRRRRAR